MKILLNALLFPALLMPVGARSVQTEQAAKTTQPAQDMKPTFSIKITAVEDAVKSGSEVAVKFILTNTSNHEISIPWIMRRGGGIKLDVRDGQGKLVRGIKEYIAEKNKGSGRSHPSRAVINAGSVAAVHLRPGQTTSEDLFVSDMYDLHQAGTYTIQVQRTDDESKTIVSSNTIAVTVTP